MLYRVAQRRRFCRHLPLEEATLMRSLDWADLAVALLGALGCVWAAVYLPRRYRGAVRYSRWPQAVRWLWRTGWTAGALAAIALAALRIRYPEGARLVIRDSASPIDRVVRMFGIFCIIGFFVVLLAWRLALSWYVRGARRQGVGR